MASQEIKLIKNNVSNIDIYVLSKELNKILEEGFISNVYELPEAQSKTLILKFRSKSGKKYLIVDPKKRINITQFKYPVPPFPSQFINSLRKVIKGRRIERIYQFNLDRILVFELKSNTGEPWKFVIEFFAGGNYILLDGEGNTYMAQSYKKMRNREILAKRPYQFPTSRGYDLWDLDYESFLSAIKDQKKEIVRIIARTFNIGGTIAEEILARANIDKNIKVPDLTDEQLTTIFKSIQEIVKILNEEIFSPRILLDEDKNPIGFDAFPLKIHENINFQDCNSLNEAVDIFFSKYDSENLFSGEQIQSQKKVLKQEKILQQQLDTIESSKENREKYLDYANLIYQYMFDIDQLISTIMQQKREHNRSWKEISTILNEGKKQNIPACKIFDKIFPKEMKIQVNLEGNLLKLELKYNAVENAQNIYDKAKKAKRRIKGAKIAAEMTKEKLKIQQEKQEQIEAQKAILLKKPKSKWYEKFRWFISTDNFVVIAGRDASSNEAIVSKHMNKHDLFLHADVRGGAVCIIKNDDKSEIPESTINQAATFASCYSSAWKNGWGHSEIYFVHPEQVSKTPQSGEYLNKGSFVISGTKNYLPKPPLKIAIGIRLIPIYNQITSKIGYDEKKNDQNLSDWNKFEQEINEDGEQVQYYPKVIASPKKAISYHTLNYVIIKPSKNGLKTSSLAKKILYEFEVMANEAAKRWIRLTPIDDIIRKLPPGNGTISEKK